MRLPTVAAPLKLAIYGEDACGDGRVEYARYHIVHAHRVGVVGCEDDEVSYRRRALKLLDHGEAVRRDGR
eukprot:3103725-Prymnesium_polylepis.1